MVKLRFLRIKVCVPIIRTIPLAGIAEMADRVRAGDWSPNLATVLGP